MAAYQKIGISVHELNASCPGYQAQAKAHSEGVRSGCNTLEKSPGLPVAGALSPAVNFFSLVRSILDCDLVRVLERRHVLPVCIRRCSGRGRGVPVHCRRLLSLLSHGGAWRALPSPA